MAERKKKKTKGYIKVYEDKILKSVENPVEER